MKQGEKRPQQLMHCHRKEDDHHMRFFAEDVNERAIKKYYLLTADALYRLLMDNKRKGIQNCFYEIMPSSNCLYGPGDRDGCKHMLQEFGTRLYLDIEFPAGADFTDYETSVMSPLQIGASIAKEIHTFLEMHLTVDCELIVLKSHRESKFSWHMIAVLKKDGKEVLFKDSLCVLTIINEWFEQRNLDKFNYFKEDNIEESAIDVSVYATHKLYRTMYSSKFNKKIPLQFATYFPVRQVPTKPTFEETLCLQLLEGRELLDIEPTASSTKLRSVVSAKKRKSASNGVTKLHRKKHKTTSFNIAAEMFFSNWSVWQEMKNFLTKQWPTIQFEKASFKSIFLIYVPLDYDFRCPLKRGSNNGCHKSNHSCLWIKPKIGLIEWRCHDHVCKQKKVMKVISFPMHLANRLRRMYTHRYCIKLE